MIKIHAQPKIPKNQLSVKSDINRNTIPNKLT